MRRETQQLEGYYLYYPNPSPPHGYLPFQWPVYSGYPPQPLQAAHPPPVSTASAAHTSHGGNSKLFGWQERGERNHLKSSARSFSSLLQVLPVSHQSLSLSFLFDITFLIWFPLPGFLVIAFAIHAPSFPFSDRLFIGILASLLLRLITIYSVYPSSLLYTLIY